MDDIWKVIAEDYETAKKCLWCTKHAGNWFRQEDKGRYHLWKAYYVATQAETKEMEKVNFLYDSLKYVLKKIENTSEQVIEAYKHIEGLNDVQDFCFHDSKQIWFEHTSETAKLKLDFDGIVVTFGFDGIIDIEVNGDPTMNWINDFYCYPAFHNKNVLHFDIGLLQNSLQENQGYSR